MNPARRTVRAAANFFEDLDPPPAERGSNGEPSTNDFQTLELLEIVDRFAAGFDELPELIECRPDYRILISTGLLVRAFAVVGQLAPDGAVELIGFDIDPSC